MLSKEKGMNRLQLSNLPDSMIIESGGKRLDANEIKAATLNMQELFEKLGVKQAGLYLDNSPEWLLVSLVTMASNITLVPLPIFFSEQQLNHILSSTDIDCLLGANPDFLIKFMPNGSLIKITDSLYLIHEQKHGTRLGSFSGILTFTSGSTSSPKGVLLPYSNVYKQIEAIYNHLQPDYDLNYLTITPLSILLENIIGLVTLFHGSTVHVNSVHRFLDIANFSLKVEEINHYINENKINTLLLMPLFLKQWIDHLEQQGLSKPASIQYIALGGAMTPINILEKAQKLGLPVYQGYGLSESCSVVSMNTKIHNKLGSVGKVLPHVTVRITDQQNILVKGNLFQSYLGEAPINPDEFYDTGDLGYLENDYLYITGRQKNIMVLQSGRNVSPEWIENEILRIPSVSNVVVIADSRPYVTIIIDPKEHFEVNAFDKELKNINKRLPGFAQIHKFIIANEPFTRTNRLLNMKHRPDSRMVIEHYQSDIDKLYND